MPPPQLLVAVEPVHVGLAAKLAQAARVVAVKRAVAGAHVLTAFVREPMGRIIVPVQAARAKETDRTAPGGDITKATLGECAELDTRRQRARANAVARPLVARTMREGVPAVTIVIAIFRIVPR